MKSVIFSPLAGTLMLAGGVGVAAWHHDWTAVSLFVAGLAVMYVLGRSMPGARQ